MIDHFAVDDLDIPLEKSFNDKCVTNGGVGEAHGGLHILNICEVLFTLKDRTILLLTLKNVSTVTYFHSFLTVVVETVEVEQCDLLPLFQQGSHPLQSLTVRNQLCVLGYINLLSTFEVRETFILTLSEFQYAQYNISSAS